jgi:penicillin-binding protein 2
MPPESIYEDLSLVRRRANKTFRTFAVIVVLVVAYYWKVQVLDHRRFLELAEANRTRVRTLAAPRGLIYDRNRVILADNHASFKVSYVRENVKDVAASLAEVGRLLGIDPAALRDRMEQFKDSQPFEPIVIKDGLSSLDIAPIESRRLEFPELLVDAEPQRLYPFKTLAAHVLGYLQERTPAEIRAEPDRAARLGEMVGKTGVEREYESLLKGTDGTVNEVVDSLGRLQYERNRQYPLQGNEIVLALDHRIQSLAEEVLAGREGVAVVMDVPTGGILALASFPTFDPNRFITRFTPDEWLGLVNDPLAPLENRAIRGLYAPGSIFKTVMALGGLDFGYVTNATSVWCSGSTEVYGSIRHCWFEQGHGAMNVVEAIKNSCNIYFYQLGRRMSIDMIHLAAGRLGLGQKTGIDLAGEKEGLVPSSDWKKKALKEPWFPGETISVAIGQGQLQVTPLQVAVLTAAIATKGRIVRPRLLMDGAAEGSGTVDRERTFKPAAFESVIAGMWGSVNDQGTGKGAFVAGMDICGKTGSTQVIGREAAERLAQTGREIKTHSWFTGFAPRSDPRVVVTVLVEYGGGGGTTAAPLAGRIFELYKELYQAK